MTQALTFFFWSHIFSVLFFSIIKLSQLEMVRIALYLSTALYHVAKVPNFGAIMALLKKKQKAQLTPANRQVDLDFLQYFIFKSRTIIKQCFSALLT